MQIHELKFNHKSKKSKRIGRGGKRGTYSGRGMKGQKSRAGRRLKPDIRELIKRYPKLRGYKFKTKFQATPTVVVNLDILERKFDSGAKVNPEALLEKKIISRIKGRTPKVKILGNGGIAQNLIIENCQVSAAAKKKIEKAGGTVNEN